MQTFGDVIEHLHSEVLRDFADPPLWSTAALCEFVAQAHDQFAEDTLCIRDATSAAARVTLRTGVEFYPLSESVLAVMSARVDGVEHGLVRAAGPAIDGYVPSPEVVQWLERVNYGAPKDGQPLVFATDYSVSGAGAVALRVWPRPSAEFDGRKVLLRVIRLPAVQCSLDTLEVVPEIPRQSRMALVHGAAMFAYGSQDADGEDGAREAKYRALFNADIERAKVRVARAAFQPVPWGFNHSGFTCS